MNCKSINFGGFVSPSTVDWPGRSSSVVFFRGCPLGCTYCHNSEICKGFNQIDIEAVYKLITDNQLLTSGVVFSGGECTLQGWALKSLCWFAKDRNIPVGIHTSGIMPGIIEELTQKDLVQFISLDIKSTWDRYSDIVTCQSALNMVPWIRENLERCTDHYHDGSLKEFRVAYTAYDTTIIDDVRAQISDDIQFIVQEKR